MDLLLDVLPREGCPNALGEVTGEDIRPSLGVDTLKVGIQPDEPGDRTIKTVRVNGLIDAFSKLPVHGGSLSDGWDSRIRSVWYSSSLAFGPHRLKPRALVVNQQG